MVTRIKNQTIVKTFWPIFSWYECSNCGKEFRRETGFYSQVSMRINKYLCNECGKNIDHAIEYFKAKKWLPKRNKNMPPTPPPIRTFVNNCETKESKFDTLVWSEQNRESLKGRI